MMEILSGLSLWCPEAADEGGLLQGYSSNRPVSHAYLFNQHGTTSGLERIIAWKVDPTSGRPARVPTKGSSVINGYYTSDQLQIKSTKGEQGHEVREYSDRDGHVVLKKVQYVDTNPVLNDSTHWTQTYYVYELELDPIACDTR